MWKQSSIWLCAALSVFWVGAFAGPVAAQLMSKWGHPVFSVGATPYDTTDQGHGEYPGSPGFLPGYGYYRPGHYPWLDGPGVPFDRRKLCEPGPGPEIPSGPAVVENPPPGAALLIVKIPEEAEFWIGGVKTSQDGSYRRFTTPVLPEGRSSYTLQVRWRIRDVELRRVETVEVRPGSVVTVNFLTTDSWTGWRSVAPFASEG
jgi:uncharacterized protein (TIGR03000 family)